MPLQIHKDSVCSIKPNSEQGRLMRLCRLVVWDECSMTQKNHIDAVDRMLKDVRSLDNPQLKSEPFGGMLMVFGGDFRQILPVIRKQARPGVINQCINRSRLWRFVRVFRLRVNMRVLNAQNSNDMALADRLQTFANYLLSVGDGKVPGFRFNGNDFAPAADTDYIPMSLDMLIPGDNVHSLINSTLPLLSTVGADMTSRPWVDMLTNSIVMTPMNADVQILNDIMLAQIPGQEVIYRSADKCSSEEAQIQYPPEIMNNIDVGGLPPHLLKLKPHCPIILLRNISPSTGLCNGTRLIIEALLPNVISARIVSGSKIGDVVLIPKISLNSPDESPINFQRHQFPIRLAFAMSVNKAQGQTLQKVGLYLPKPVFSHGQLYVALSRVQNPSSVKVLIEQSEDEKQKRIPLNCTRNVVFTEVFL
jgi:hypothetical protein